MLIHVYDNETEHMCYWSNSCGDLHHNGEYSLNDETELPPELQRAFNDLFSEGIYGVRLYLFELFEKYGVLLEASYDDCYAEDLGISYEELIKIAKEKAIECWNKYPEYDVLFGKEWITFSDGSCEAGLAIFVPWDISAEKFDEVGRWFESMVYKIEKVTTEPDMEEEQEVIE